MFLIYRAVLSSVQDVTDLFGTDLPVEGGKGGEFAWRDGPLLAGLKAGHWIVLDEVKMNGNVFRSYFLYRVDNSEISLYFS